MSDFKKGELVLVETGDKTAPYQVRKLDYDVNQHDTVAIVQNSSGTYSYECDTSSIHKLPKTLVAKFEAQS